MGGGSSKQRKRDEEALALLKDDEPENKHWVENKTFQAENSLIYASSDVFNELRGLLEEPLGQKYLGQFAKSENSQENFFAWIDMEEFKSIPTPDYRRCVAKNIFQKYIKHGAIMQLGGITDERVKYFEKLIHAPVDAANRKKDTINQNTFVSLQHMVFRELAENTFKRFKESEPFKEYETAKSKTYNKVDVNDFDYMAFLGQGAFGAVARVKKQSTGEHYALKVMSKAKLLKTFGRRCKTFEARRAAICIERDVYVNTVFPFIVGMHYSFQTELDAIIVMEFAPGGTLEDLIKSSPDNHMPEDHVRFVVAELCLALHHLHCMNYVHRDLKPINILLDGNGHVKLADMGLVSRIDDEQEVCLLDDDNISRDDGSSDTSSQSHAVLDIHTTNFKPRRFTKVGTMGYKAPELLQARRPRPLKDLDEDADEELEPEPASYGESVDWWSLGVLTVEMYCGKNIFAPKLMMIMNSNEPEMAELKHITSCGIPSSHLPESSNVSDKGKAFVDGILQTDPAKRLGMSEDGFLSIKEHPWLQGLEFQKLLNLEIAPPYKVNKVVHHEETPKWDSFESMRSDVESVNVESIMGGEGKDDSVDKKNQKYFDEWDYVAPTTFRLELGKQQQRINPNII